MLAAELMGRMGLKARAESWCMFGAGGNLEPWRTTTLVFRHRVGREVADAFCSELNHVREVLAAPNIHSGFSEMWRRRTQRLVY
jgi:hypothetical protein